MSSKSPNARKTAPQVQTLKQRAAQARDAAGHVIERVASQVTDQPEAASLPAGSAAERGDAAFSASGHVSHDAGGGHPAASGPAPHREHEMGRHETFETATPIAGEMLLEAMRMRTRRKPEAEPATSFEPITTTASVRTPTEWQKRIAPHFLAVHVTDRVLRMDRAEIAAFIREAGERNAEMPADMLEHLGLAVREFTMLADMTTAAHARFYVAAGDAIGETVSPEKADPTPAAVDPQDVFDGIATTTREAAADALADDRVSPELRAAIEAHRDATVAMLLEPDTSNEATEVRCAAVEASGEALRAVPARSIADVRAKLAFLLPEILPDVNGSTPTAFIEDIFDDVERLAARPADGADPVFTAIAASRAAEAAMEAFGQAHWDGISPAQRAQETALSEAQIAARNTVWAVAPTTRAGRLALVEFARFQAELFCGPGWRDDALATDGVFGEAFLALATAIEAEPYDAPPTSLPDLSSLTIAQLSHLHEAVASLWYPAGMYLNAPYSWDGERRNYNQLGHLIESEVDRLEGLARAAAEELARRRPADDGDRDHRLYALVRHSMLGGGPIDDPGLVAEVAVAWGG